MLVLAKDEANEKVKKEKKNLKYEYKVNMNIFIGKPKGPKLVNSSFLTRAPSSDDYT